MELTTLTQFFSTVGFPIGCAVFLLWFCYCLINDSKEEAAAREDRLLLQLDKSNERIAEVQNSTNTQLEKFGDTLDRFNSTLTKVDTRLEAVEKAVLK